MKGINPFILNSIALILLIALFGVVYFMNLYIISFIAVMLAMVLILYIYSVIKVIGVDKGKLVYKPKSSLKFRGYYDSLVIILIGCFMILLYKDIFPSWLIVSIIILDFIYRHLGNYIFRNPPIKIHEKGIVLGDTAFYEWYELNINDKGDKLKIKIKYIPKEIVVDKNIMQVKHNNN